MKTRTNGPPCLPRGVPALHVFTHLRSPAASRGMDHSWKRDYARKRDHARNGAMQFSRG